MALRHLGKVRLRAVLDQGLTESDLEGTWSRTTEVEVRSAGDSIPGRSAVGALGAGGAARSVCTG